MTWLVVVTLVGIACALFLAAAFSTPPSAADPGLPPRVVFPPWEEVRGKSGPLGPRPSTEEAAKAFRLLGLRETATATRVDDAASLILWQNEPNVFPRDTVDYEECVKFQQRVIAARLTVARWKGWT